MSLIHVLCYGPRSSHFDQMQLDYQMRHIPITQKNDTRTDAQIQNGDLGFSSSHEKLTVVATNALPLVSLDYSGVEKTKQQWEWLQAECICLFGISLIAAHRFFLMKKGALFPAASLALAGFALYRTIQIYQAKPVFPVSYNLNKVIQFRTQVFEKKWEGLEEAKKLLDPTLRGRAAELFTENEKRFLQKKTDSLNEVD